jgi:hypothetical protein
MSGVGAEIGTVAEGLRQMDAVVERSNLWRAYERVIRNKGAAGVDGLTVIEFKAWLQQHWHGSSATVRLSCHQQSEFPIKQQDETPKGKLGDWIIF